jgi:hypothetical protein
MNSNNATPLPASQCDVAHRLGHWFTPIDLAGRATYLVAGRATYLNVDQRLATRRSETPCNDTRSDGTEKSQ